MATLRELTAQAEEAIRAHVRSGASEDTDDAVSQAADLLGALRLWADSQLRTDDDVRAPVDSVNATMQKNIASELAFVGGDDELEASRRLEGIAYSPSERLKEIFEFAQKAFPPSSADRPLWDEDPPL